MSAQPFVSPCRPSVLAATAPSPVTSPAPLELAESEDASLSQPSNLRVTQMSNKGTAIRPFTFRASDEQLDDLRRRILAARLPEKEPVSDFSQGVPLATVQKLARYWATEYSWRKVEARLNAVPNFITDIDGLDIHFIHVRSKHDNALPIIISHGCAGFHHRAAQAHRPAHQPNGARRDRGRRPRWLRRPRT